MSPLCLIWCWLLNISFLVILFFEELQNWETQVLLPVSYRRDNTAAVIPPNRLTSTSGNQKPTNQRLDTFLVFHSAIGQPCKHNTTCRGWIPLWYRHRDYEHISLTMNRRAVTRRWLQTSAKANSTGSLPVLAKDSNSSFYLLHTNNKILILLKLMAKLLSNRDKILPTFITDFIAVTESDILLPNS